MKLVKKRLSLDWQHVPTLLGHHQAYTMNQLTIKLRTFLGAQAALWLTRFIAKA